MLKTKTLQWLREQPFLVRTIQGFVLFYLFAAFIDKEWTLSVLSSNDWIIVKLYASFHFVIFIDRIVYSGGIVVSRLMVILQDTFGIMRKLAHSLFIIVCRFVPQVVVLEEEPKLEKEEVSDEENDLDLSVTLEGLSLESILQFVEENNGFPSQEAMRHFKIGSGTVKNIGEALMKTGIIYRGRNNARVLNPNANIDEINRLIDMSTGGAVEDSMLQDGSSTRLLSSAIMQKTSQIG